MDYAIIYESGKQIIITSNKLFDINYLPKTRTNDIIIFNKILLIKSTNYYQIGRPLLNCKIYGIIIQNIKKEKLTVLKFRPKKHYNKKFGFKRIHTRILVFKNYGT